MPLAPDRPWPPRDNLGRLEPRRFNLVTWMHAIPEVMAHFTRTVPDDMVSIDVAEDGTPVAVIPCSCGAEEPVVVRLAQLAECPSCERTFANFGQKIKVAPPAEPPPDPS